MLFVLPQVCTPFQLQFWPLVFCIMSILICHVMWFLFVSWSLCLVAPGISSLGSWASETSVYLDPNRKSTFLLGFGPWKRNGPLLTHLPDSVLPWVLQQWDSKSGEIEEPLYSSASRTDICVVPLALTTLISTSECLSWLLAQCPIFWGWSFSCLLFSGWSHIPLSILVT